MTVSIAPVLLYLSLGMIIISNHSDKTGERRLHYVFNVLAGAAGLVLSGIFASNPYLAIIFLSIATLGVIGSMSVVHFSLTYRAAHRMLLSLGWIRF